MTATPMLLLRGQLLEFGEYAQGESVTPGAGPGLRVQIGARQVVVPLGREQLQALGLRPDQEVELVIRPLEAAPAAPPPLFQEGDYSFWSSGGEMLTGSAAERAAMIHARRELHALVHEVLGIRRRADDDPKQRVWSARLWKLLELLVVLTRACPFCGNDPHKESCPPNLNADELALLRQIQAAGDAGFRFHKARAKKPLRRAMSSLLQDSLVCVDASLTEHDERFAMEDEDVGQRLRLTPEGEQFLASLPPAWAVAAAPLVRTRSAVGRQRVPAKDAAPPAREASAAPHSAYEPYDWQRFDAHCAGKDSDGHARALLMVTQSFLHTLLHPCHCDPQHFPSFVPVDMQPDVKRCLAEMGTYTGKLAQETQVLVAQGAALQQQIDAFLAPAHSAVVEAMDDDGGAK